jgi:hypothetical protein
MSFEDNERRKQEIFGRPLADKIYRDVFGQDIQIHRMDRKDNLVLDIRFAIDVKLVLFNGQILLGQEKFLSHKYANFQTVTVEYLQDPITGEKGDWFKLAAQFYFVGYITQKQDGFEPWILLNWANVVIATDRHEIKWEDKGNTKTAARATFKCCNMNKFPADCVIAQCPMLSKISPRQY